MKTSIHEKLEMILTEAEKMLLSAKTLADVEEVRIKINGRKGSITATSKELGKLTEEERPEAGKALNIAKNRISALFTEAGERVNNANSSIVDVGIDVTLPGRKWPFGKKHPITQTIDDCIDIFRRIGFIVADGPNIETVYHCFDALNSPEDHPSRGPSDTFYFSDGRLLRTQTSTVQIRVMETQEPPIRIVAPGPCFRPDTPDASHSANFHQLEGL